jgi:hypothetical protein
MAPGEQEYVTKQLPASIKCGAQRQTARHWTHHKCIRSKQRPLKRSKMKVVCWVYRFSKSRSEASQLISPQLSLLFIVPQSALRVKRLLVFRIAQIVVGAGDTVAAPTSSSTSAIERVADTVGPACLRLVRMVVLVLLRAARVVASRGVLVSVIVARPLLLILLLLGCNSGSDFSACAFA